MLFVQATFVNCAPLPPSVQVLQSCIFRLGMLHYQINSLKETFLPLVFMVEYPDLNKDAGSLKEHIFQGNYAIVNLLLAADSCASVMVFN